jgi:hypothetical protein
LGLLLAVSAAIDRINEKVGKVCNFLVLLACVVSAGLGHLLGRASLRRSANGHGRIGHSFSDYRDGIARQALKRRSQQNQDRVASA